MAWSLLEYWKLWNRIFRQQIIRWEKGYTDYSYPLTGTGLDIQGAQARLILVAFLRSGASIINKQSKWTMSLLFEESQLQVNVSRNSSGGNSICSLQHSKLSWFSSLVGYDKVTINFILSCYATPALDHSFALHFYVYTYDTLLSHSIHIPYNTR